MLNKDYKDMLSALSEAGVDFLLMGAYAVAVHGHPRATGDIDLWVRATKENAEKVILALKRFGAPMDNISVNDFSHEGSVLQIGVVPDRIDILTSVSGLSFDEAWKNKISFVFDGIQVNIPSKPDLIKNKRASGRIKDLADIESLE